MDRGTDGCMDGCYTQKDFSQKGKQAADRPTSTQTHQTNFPAQLWRSNELIFFFVFAATGLGNLEIIFSPLYTVVNYFRVICEAICLTAEAQSKMDNQQINVLECKSTTE